MPRSRYRSRSPHWGTSFLPQALFGTEEVLAGFRIKDGFRLTKDGRTVTRDAIERARQEQARSKHDERKTAMESVLAILATVVDNADQLRKLLLWEIQEQLRADVSAGLPWLVAGNAKTLGLDPTEANELATTLTSSGRGPDGGRAQPEAQQVRELIAGADRALVAGEQEEAARLLAEAMTIAKDAKELRERFDAIPPPPPRDPKADLNGARVIVHWTPGPARTAGVSYRIVRTSNTPAVSSDAGSVIAETKANEAVDETPPAGETLYYTVFAARGGAWSAGVSAEPIEYLPKVREVNLRADEKTVIGSWSTHPSAIEVVITRTRRDSSEKPYKVPLTDPRAATFMDLRVDIGSTYDYAFRAVYLTRTGGRRISQPEVFSATPTAPPGLVEGLAHKVVQHNGTAVVQVSWLPPASGVVEIRASGDEPDWPAGELVPRAAATAFGRPTAGQTSLGEDGRVTLTFPAPRGRVVLTAITLVGDLARIGGSIVISLVDPVTGLRADRRGNQVWLRWSWPEGTDLARVRWWSADAPHPPIALGELEISEHALRDAGSVRVNVPPGPVELSVQTMTCGRDRKSVSAPVNITVRDRPTVTYAVRSIGLPGRRRHELVLISDRFCRLPGLIVVHRADGILPLRPGSGTIVATVDPLDLIAPDIPVAVPLHRRVSPLSGLACFVDPNSPPADEVTLVSRP